MLFALKRPAPKRSPEFNQAKDWLMLAFTDEQHAEEVVQRLATEPDPFSHLEPREQRLIMDVVGRIAVVPRAQVREGPPNPKSSGSKRQSASQASRSR